MAARRTQIYLTEDQRQRLDERRRREKRSLALPYLTGTSGIVAELLVDTDVFIDHLRGKRKRA